MKKKHLLLISLVALPLLVGCKPSDQLDAINSLLANNKDNIQTCYDAVYTTGVKEKLQSKVLSGDNEYVYDIKAKQFVVMNGDKIVQSSKGYTASSSTLDYFKFVTSYNPNSKYSQYLLSTGSAPKDLMIATGFDSGIHTDINNITYTNLSTVDDNVTIRCLSDYLTIYAPYQTVTHYNDSTNILVTDVKQLNTCGICEYLKVQSGKINFDSRGTTRIFEVQEDYVDDVYIKSSEQSNVYALINCKQSDTPTEHECRVGTKLDEEKITSADQFRTACTSGTKSLLRLESDILFDNGGVAGLESIVIDHPLSIDLNGFKLSFSDFKQSSASKIREAMRVQSNNQKDCSVYLFDSTGIIDENAGIWLNDCSIVVSGYYYEQGSTKISTNLFMNSGKITQTITDNVVDSNELGGAIVLIGDTSQAQEKTKYASFNMHGGKITCNNTSKTHDKFGCIGAIGKGAYVDMLYATLVSNEFCVFGSTADGFKLENATANIVGSSLTSSDNTCIYFPLTSAINISGSSLTGATCLNVNSGELTITESSLVANGTGSYYSTKNYDGSVIYVPKEKLDDGELTVNVDDSSLTSKFEYIVNVTGGEGTNKSTISFNSGTYTYKKGEGYIASPKTTLTKNGTWIKKQY